VDSLRGYVVLNYMAVIKIVKKRNKNVDPLFDGQINAQSILLSQHFYRSRIVADLLTFTELMILKHNSSGKTPDKANFMCAVCLECLNNPVVLTCGHRFCFGCAVRCTSQTVIQEEVVQCPTCRKQGPCQPTTFTVDTSMTVFLIDNFGIGDEDEAKKMLQNQPIPHLPEGFKPSKVEDARWTMKCLPSPPRDDGSATDEPFRPPAMNNILEATTDTPAETPILVPATAPISPLTPGLSGFLAISVPDGVGTEPGSQNAAVEPIPSEFAGKSLTL